MGISGSETYKTAEELRINAVMESSRLCTRFTTEGRIFASRLPDLQIRVNVVPEKLRWQTVDIVSLRGEGGIQ